MGEIGSPTEPEWRGEQEQYTPGRRYSQSKSSTQQGKTAKTTHRHKILPRNLLWKHPPAKTKQEQTGCPYHNSEQQIRV